NKGELASKLTTPTFCLAELMAYLHETSGGNYMAEGSRVAVCSGMPTGDKPSRFLAASVQLSKQRGLHRPLLGLREKDGWVSARHGRWWELENEPTEGDLRPLEQKWKEGGYLTLADYGKLLGQLSAAQQAFLSKMDERLVVDFPLEPLRNR